MRFKPAKDGEVQAVTDNKMTYIASAGTDGCICTLLVRGVPLGYHTGRNLAF